MTSRERFLRAVTHQSVDRVVVDLFGSPQTTIMNEETVVGIKKELGLTGDEKGNGYIDERILRYAGADVRITGGFPVPENPFSKSLPNGYVDFHGIEYTNMNGHPEITKNPLKDMTFEQIKEYPFPDADKIDKNLFEQYKQHAKALFEETDYAVCAQHPVYGVFELGCWMFGFDDFLYRMAGEPETVIWFFDKIWEYQKRVIELYYSAVGPYIHCTTSGDDFGTQRGLLISANMFREMIAPYLKKRIAYTKQFTKAYFKQHTCGSVYELIPALIECGVDILNPIQPGTYLMEPERLKADFGGKISFWGGVDTQHLLVNGTVDEVKIEVKKLLDIFGTDGGFILSPAHCLQADVPPRNILALYDTVKEYYKA